MPAVAVVPGGGVIAAHVPTLRSQIRDGVVGVPFCTISPIAVRRDQHPLAFPIWTSVICSVVALIFVGCIALLVRAVAA